MGFFTAENYKQGLTMAIGVIILCAITFQDSFESTFSKSGTPPALALVVWCAFSPYYSGMSTILFPLLIIGDLFLYASYYSIIYVTYGIVGPDWAPRTDKAVTLCIVSTVVVAILQLIRVRFPALGTSGMLAQLISAMVLFTAVYYKAQFPPTELNFTWQFFLISFIPACVGSLISMFIVPHHAGEYSIELLGNLLGLTGQVQSSVTEKLLLAEVDEKTGKMAPPPAEKITTATEKTTTRDDGDDDSGSTITEESTSLMQEGLYLGVASALEPLVLPIHAMDVQSWKLSAGLDALQKLAALEFNVYKRPHIFPRKAFSAVFTPIRTMQQLYVTIVGFMDGGQVPMRAFPLIKNELEEMKGAVKLGLNTLKQVIVDGYAYEKGLMECVPRVDAACVALKEKISTTESGGVISAEDCMVARELSSIVLLAGKELRKAWEAASALIAARQPEAAVVAEPFFTANKTTIGTENTNGIYSSGEQKKQIQPTTTTTTTTTSVIDTQAPSGASFREVVKLTPTCSALRLHLFNLTMSTGIHSWHLKMVLHMSFVFAVAATLNVIPQVNKALDYHAYWILVTIFVISDTTTGGIVDNGWQRILGTLIGCVGVSATAGFAYLANGSSYNGLDAAAKVTQAAIASIWMGVFRLLQSKYEPRLYKLFYISTLMVPLIAFVDSKGEDVWSNLKFRIANTCIGVMLHTFASMVLFPVTAGDHINEKTADCLLHIATMLDDIAALPLVSSPNFSPMLDSTKTSGGGCLGRFRGRKSTTGSTAAASTKKPDPSEVEDLEAAAAAVLESIPNYNQQEAMTEEDETADAAKAIISNGIQKAETTLLDIIKLRDIVDKEYLVTKLAYTCLNGSSSSGKDPKGHQQQLKRAGCGLLSKMDGGLWKDAKPPMQVYQLDQLIYHLKHNIVSSNIILLIREWLRSDKTFFTKHPELAVAVRAFGRQSGECLKALRLAILKVVEPKDTLETVLNLRKMSVDIGQLCNSSEHFGLKEATIVHTLLVTCRNIEFLYRAAARALVTHDEPGVLNTTDQVLGQGTTPMLSLLNLEATAAVVEAVDAGAASAAAADDRRGGVQTTRDGAKQFAGMMQVTGR